MFQITLQTEAGETEVCILEVLLDGQFESLSRKAM